MDAGDRSEGQGQYKPTGQSQQIETGAQTLLIAHVEHLYLDGTSKFCVLRTSMVMYNN